MLVVFKFISGAAKNISRKLGGGGCVYLYTLENIRMVQVSFYFETKYYVSVYKEWAKRVMSDWYVWVIFRIRSWDTERECATLSWVERINCDSDKMCVESRCFARESYFDKRRRLPRWLRSWRVRITRNIVEFVKVEEIMMSDCGQWVGNYLEKEFLSKLNGGRRDFYSTRWWMKSYEEDDFVMSDSYAIVEDELKGRMKCSFAVVVASTFCLIIPFHTKFSFLKTSPPVKSVCVRFPKLQYSSSKWSIILGGANQQKSIQFRVLNTHQRSLIKIVLRTRARSPLPHTTTATSDCLV